MVEEKFDKYGRLVSFRKSDGLNWQRDFDEKGNEVHFRHCDAEGKVYEKWNEFDERGNLIHMRTASGFESWRDYDENGNEIHTKNSEGYEKWYEYKNGEVVRGWDSKGREWR